MLNPFLNEKKNIQIVFFIPMMHKRKLGNFSLIKKNNIRIRANNNNNKYVFSFLLLFEYLF